MSNERNLHVTCPECGGELVVDPSTGRVVFHAAKTRRDAPRKDFDSLLADLGASKDRADEVFDRELSALGDRDRLLEEKFREAMRRAEENPDEKPPLRPWDLD